MGDVDKKQNITVVIPAYNEADRIGELLKSLTIYPYPVVVLDDYSRDDTGRIASENGAEVIRNPENLGYLKNLVINIPKIRAEIMITLDADGEHPVHQIPKLLKPLLDDQADVVFGARRKIPRISERLLSGMSRMRSPIHDSGSGFRAFRTSFTRDIEKVKGRCPCGVLAVFFVKKQARMQEVSIDEIPVKKPRGIAWRHIMQFFHLLKAMF